MSRCWICGKEMTKTIGGCEQCSDCGVGLDDLVFRTRNNSKDNSLDKFVEKYPTYIEALDIIDDLKKQLEEKDADIVALDTDNYSFKRQIDNLRQQLKSQPKEIVEKIRNICCVEDKCEDGSFILGINEKDLDTILKEYQN